MNPIEAAEWMSVPEAAVYLKCSDVWVLKLLKRGELTGRKINGRAWIVSRASVVENDEEAQNRDPSLPGRKREGLPAESRLPKFDRITHDPKVARGEACIRKTRIRVAALVSLLAKGVTPAELVALHDGLDAEDIRQAIRYAQA